MNNPYFYTSYFVSKYFKLSIELSDLSGGFWNSNFKSLYFVNPYFWVKTIGSILKIDCVVVDGNITREQEISGDLS
jgi:hypothetical protein